MFLNCKVKNESISKYIKDVLGVESNKIEYKFDKVHTEFSQKDKIDKEYLIKGYNLNVDRFKNNGGGVYFEEVYCTNTLWKCSWNKTRCNRFYKTFTPNSKREKSNIHK